MKTPIPLFILAAILLPLLAPAQDCPPTRYRLMLRQVDTAVLRGQYDLAINKLQSAKTCQPDSEAVVNRRVLEVFRAVNAERTKAIKNEKEAKRQQSIAKTNLAKASRLIHHLNFQEEVAAWAYKHGKFAVINLNGDTLTNFIYENPEDFHNGVAIAKANNQYTFINDMGKECSGRYDYLLPTTKGRYVTQSQVLDKEGKFVFSYEKRPREDKYCAIVKDKKTGLIDSIGNIIVEPRYEVIGMFSDGLAKVKNKKWGFINQKGEEVIPLIYGDVEDFKEGVAWVNFGDDRWHGGKWGLLDLSGTPIIEPRYDYVNSFSNGLARVNLGGRWEREYGYAIDGKWTFVDKRGIEQFSPIECRRINYFGGGISGIQTVGWGMINLRGEIKMKPQFIDLKPFVKGLIWVNNKFHNRNGDNEWNLVDTLGNEVIETKYQYVDNISEGLSMVYLNGNAGFVDEQGKEVIRPKYQSARRFSEGLASVNTGLNWGFINRLGEEVIAAKFDETEDFNNGRALVRTGFRWGAIDRHGTELIKSEYIFLSKFEAGIARAREESGTWKYLEETGTEPCLTKFQRILDINDTLLIAKVVDKWRLIDMNGKNIVSPPFDSICDFVNDYAKVRRGKKWGFINRNGEEVVELKYDEIEDFQSNGYAKINIGCKWDNVNDLCEGGKWGFIDWHGSEIVSPKYDYIRDFSGDFAIVCLEKKLGAINQNGREVVQPKYDRMENFSGDWAKVSKTIIDSTGHEPVEKWGFVDTTGHEIITLKHAKIGDYNEKIAWINIGGEVAGHTGINDKWGLMYCNGLIQVLPRYKTTKAWIEGFSAVENEKGLWGFVNKQGIETIAPYYDQVRNFSNGLSEVKLGKKWGYIDSAGIVIISPQYEKVEGFIDGFAKVQKEGNWGLINRNGYEVVKPQYLEIENFHEGIALAKSYSASTYINKNGNQINQETYDTGTEFNGGYALIFKGNKAGFINTSGNTTSLHEFASIGLVDHGFARIEIFNKTGLLDTLGHFALPCAFSNIYPSGYRIYTTEQNGLFGLFAPDYGVLLPCNFEQIGLLAEENGWIRVRQNGKWGWVACEKGEEDTIKVVQKIPFRFDAAAPFQKGIARVMQLPYTEEFKINTKGEMLLGQ